MNVDNLKKTKSDRHLPGPGIVNKYWLRGTLKTKSPLHIGTGEHGQSWKQGAKPGGNCNYVLLSSKAALPGQKQRDDDGRPWAYPVLPGSSLRGVLRSWLEGILYPYNSPGAYDVASLSATDFEFEQGITREYFDRELRRIRAEAAAAPPRDVVGRDRQVEAKLEERLKEKADLVGFLFGSTLVRGRVAFGNAVAQPKEKDGPFVRDELFAIRTGVSIDRDTGAAADDKLFDIEVVQPRVVFPVELRFTNVRYWEIGLVLAALEVFNHPTFPLQLGAHTQQGFGRMEWTLKSVRQLGHDAKTDKPALADWLAHLSAGAAPTAPDPRRDLGAPQAAGRRIADPLDIGRRGIPGVTDAASFRDHCVTELQKVLAYVCA